MGSSRLGSEKQGGEWLLQRDSVEQLARIGTWRWCPENGELDWSANLFRILGLEPGEVVPSAESIVKAAAPEDRARLNDELRQLADGVPRPPIDYRLATSAGETRWVRAKSVLVDSSVSGERWLCGVVQDITEQAWAEKEIDVYHALSSALVQWGSLETGAPELLGAVARAIGFDFAVLWIPAEQFLLARAVWSRRAASDMGARRPRPGLRLRGGEALAGRVWESGKLHYAEDVADAALASLEPEQPHGDFRIVLGLPAITPEQEVIAVLTFAADEPIDLGDRLLGSLSEVGLELGAFLAHRRHQLQQNTLSARELEILQLSAHGLSMTEVADELHVSRSTVKSHLDHVYRKLRVSGRTSAVAEMMRRGAIT